MRFNNDYYRERFPKEDHAQTDHQDHSATGQFSQLNESQATNNTEDVSTDPETQDTDTSEGEVE